MFHPECYVPLQEYEWLVSEIPEKQGRKDCIAVDSTHAAFAPFDRVLREGKW